MSMPQPDLAELRDAMREISAEALRAGTIIRRMRQLVRIEPVEHVALDPTALLEDLKILISADARINGVDVAYAFATKGCHVLADGVQLQQLVLNLLRNAFEALAAQPAGSRRVEVASSVLADGNLEISITDNGPGVSSAIADRLFEPFCTTKPGGTGLGLAISRTIAQAHRGSVGYRAAAPHGTCFYVRLPAVEDSAK
jgi:signal transduction histidine kinase